VEPTRELLCLCFADVRQEIALGIGPTRCDEVDLPLVPFFFPFTVVVVLTRGDGVLNFILAPPVPSLTT